LQRKLVKAEPSRDSASSREKLPAGLSAGVQQVKKQVASSHFTASVRDDRPASSKGMLPIGPSDVVPLATPAPAPAAAHAAQPPASASEVERRSETEGSEMDDEDADPTEAKEGTLAEAPAIPPAESSAGLIHMDPMQMRS
jgi:hypothetical protein